MLRRSVPKKSMSTPGCSSMLLLSQQHSTTSGGIEPHRISNPSFGLSLKIRGRLQLWHWIGCAALEDLEVSGRRKEKTGHLEVVRGCLGLMR